MAYSSTKRYVKILEELNAASEVVDTACGPVEFARRGEAPYVVIFHGTPQGHHASFLGESFEAAGFGTLTPSRPGYLRTPLETGRTFREQADAVAALLDVLSIDMVAAYAVSGGGPSGIEFAAAQGDRVEALILEVAISQTYAPQVSGLAVRVVSSPVFDWIQRNALSRFPRLALAQMLKFESTLNAAERARVARDILKTPSKLDYLGRFLAGTPPMGLLRAGFVNDLEQFAAIKQLPLASVRCPTLVVHGTLDGDVPFSHGEHAARGIPGAEFHRVEGGWHLLALGDAAEDHTRAEVDFVRAHLAQDGSG